MYIISGYVKWLALLENCLTASYTDKHTYTLRPSNSTFRYLLGRNETHTHKKNFLSILACFTTSAWIITVSTIINSPKSEQLHVHQWENG